MKRRPESLSSPRPAAFSTRDIPRLLYHGAGGDKDHHTLVAIEERLAIPVRRCSTYRSLGSGPRPPDRMPKLIDAIRADAARAVAGQSIAPTNSARGSINGWSCDHDGHAAGLPCAGLVLLSYPLHPPGKPQKLRVEHLPEITAPVLVVHGSGPVRVASPPRRPFPGRGWTSHGPLPQEGGP
ncbi:MAG: alpha/beta family hydrolase [Acidimicrobiales bacterium]